VAEGIKGKRAVEWNLVDAIAPLSRWSESVRERARKLADSVPVRGTKGVALDAIEPRETPISHGTKLAYTHVDLSIDNESRTAELEIRAPETAPETAEKAFAEGAAW